MCRNPAIAGLTSTGEHLVLMVDECQRVAEGKRKQLQEIRLTLP